MKTLIINLARATDRMEFMRAQMADLGLDWERIEAVTPATLQPPADDPVWHRWQRPMRSTEMALCASHMAAWQRVIALGAPCLVLEDDALLSRGLPGFLAQIAGLAGIDHISLETRSRKKLVARMMHPDAPIRRLWQDRTGSAAYVVFPHGAKALLAHAQRSGAPSDALISATYAMRSFQADPALSIQLDQCRAYGLVPPIETASLIDAVGKPGLAGDLALPRRIGYRLRRIGAQLRMGVRHVIRLGRAHRRAIAPAGDLWGGARGKAG